MIKFVIFLVFLFSIGTILSATLEGAMGLASTVLTESIGPEATTIYVESTEGFRAADFLWIGDERIAYGGKTATSFTNVVRGVGGTTAVAHPKGRMVYNSATNAINQLVGFNIAASVSTVGVWKTLLQTPRFLGAVAKMLTWDYAFLTGELALIKFTILYPLSAGFVFGMAMITVNVVQGLFRLGG